MMQSDEYIQKFHTDYPFLLSSINELTVDNGNIILLEDIAKLYDTKVSILKKLRGVPAAFCNHEHNEFISVLNAINIHNIPSYKQIEEFTAFAKIVKYLLVVAHIVVGENNSELAGNWINTKSKQETWVNLELKIADLLRGVAVVTDDSTSYSLPITQPWTKDCIRFVMLLLLKRARESNQFSDLHWDQIVNVFDSKYIIFAKSFLQNLSPENVLKIGYRWYNLMTAKKAELENNNFYKNLSWENVLKDHIADGIEIRNLTTGQDLLDEGNLMANCANLYHLRILFDQYFILSYLDKGEKLLTLEAGVFNTEDKPIFKVLQIKKYANEDLESDSPAIEKIRAYEQTATALPKDANSLQPKVIHNHKTFSKYLLDDITLSTGLNGVSYEEYLVSVFESLKLNHKLKFIDEYQSILTN